MTAIKWNVSKSLINIFKSYPHKAAYNGPMKDNLCIVCGPNGFRSSSADYFVAVISFNCTAFNDG